MEKLPELNMLGVIMILEYGGYLSTDMMVKVLEHIYGVGLELKLQKLVLQDIIKLD